MSDSYSPTERMIAGVLARVPFIKKIIKKSYSQLVYLRSKKDYEYKSDLDVVCLNANPVRESFFGYFDKTPASEKGYTLIHITDARTDCLPQSSKAVSLAVIDPTGEVLFEVETYAFNWQQGSRAHWLDNDHFIFNDYDEQNQRYVSRMYSVTAQKEIKRFDYAVQESFQNDYFLSLNYRRLMAMRPDYGYRNLPAMTKDELQTTKHDGIWKVVLNSGKSELLLSISDIKRIDHEENFDIAKHKVNHVSICPSGEHFFFLHRYFVGQRRFDRLMLSTTDGKQIKVLAAYGMVSHCFWVDDSSILGYLRGPGEKDAYWLINIHTGNMIHFADGALDSYGDGHPHVVGDWFITDTYPDKARMQCLLLCNWKTGEVKCLGEFFHGFSFDGETRCDLHPRMSTDGNSVFFDSVFSGKRQLYRISLNEESSAK